MNITISNKKEEPLLSRSMVTATLEFEKSTPSYADLTTALASQLKVDQKLVAIRHIYTEFGNRKGKAIVYIYSDEQKKQFFEPKVKVKKDKKAAAEPAKK